MKAKDLKVLINDFDDDAEIVIAKAFVIDEKEELMAVVDVPVLGIAYNETEEEKEIRFVLRSDDVRRVFKPEEIHMLDDPINPDFEKADD